MYFSSNVHYKRSIIFWGERRGLGNLKQQQQQQRQSCTAKTQTEIVHGEKHRASVSNIISLIIFYVKKFLHELLPTKKIVHNRNVRNKFHAPENFQPASPMM